jgi:hypothetical protein
VIGYASGGDFLAHQVPLTLRTVTVIGYGFLGQDHLEQVKSLVFVTVLWVEECGQGR